jgi:hypothetical protein
MDQPKGKPHEVEVQIQVIHIHRAWTRLGISKFERQEGDPHDDSE